PQRDPIFRDAKVLLFWCDQQQKEHWLGIPFCCHIGRVCTRACKRSLIICRPLTSNTVWCSVLVISRFVIESSLGSQGLDAGGLGDGVGHIVVGGASNSLGRNHAHSTGVAIVGVLLISLNHVVGSINQRSHNTIDGVCGTLQSSFLGQTRNVHNFHVGDNLAVHT